MLIVIAGAFFAATLNIVIQYLISVNSAPEKRLNIRDLWYECSKNLTVSSVVFLLTISTTYLLIPKYGYGYTGITAILFTYSLIVLIVVDLKLQILPDVITKPLIVIGIAQSYFGLHSELYDSLAGAFIGYFLLWTINTIFRMVRKKEGMGYGDFKLFSAIGAWTGATQFPLVILLSSVVGLIVAVTTLKLSRKDMSHPVPFGPSLAVTGFISLVYGKQMMQVYLDFVMP